MIIKAIILGIVLGQLFVWAFSASKAYKSIVNDTESSVKKVRGALINKVASFALTLIALLTFTIIIGASRDNSFMRLVIFVSSALTSAVLIWRMAYQRKQ